MLNQVIEIPKKLLILSALLITFLCAFDTVQAAPIFEGYENHIITSSTTAEIGARISDMVIADFNNDGSPDIVGTIPQTFTNENEEPDPGEGVVILLNDGEGHFSISSYVSYEENLTAIISEDFDNDGDVDLMTVNSNSDDLALLLNDGNANFVLSSRFQTNVVPERIISEDFDGDGDFDVAVSVQDGIEIFLNDGEASFDSMVLITTSVTNSDFVAADFDNDGDVDLLSGSRNGIGIYSQITNDGSGNFEVSEVTLYTEENGEAPEFDRIISGDIDGDGDFDVVATMNGSQSVRFITMLNDGDGIFTVGQTMSSGGPSPVGFSDLDNDNDLDLILSGSGNNEIYFWLNDGVGFFTQTSETITIDYLGYVSSINCSDLNEDGLKDFIVSSDSQYGIYIFLQSGIQEPTPEELAQALVTDVVSLDLSNNLENSYLANLFKVEGFIENDQITPAINQLNAFINKLNQDYNQGKISVEVHDSLVSSAQQLISDLSN